jgi:phage shock protein PspC (stress-responsive transcriptional regulator)
MQKVITINLNGVAYQVDESGYAALVAYLEGAERQLAANPDRAEIVADLEQAIADKCRAFLNPHKTVVAAAEVDQIIKEMGPVDGAGGADAGGASDAPTTAAAPPRSPRRLYRIREGAMLEGVCTGLAAYTGIHVVFVRLVFLGLIVWSAGLGLIGYWLLASSIPEASTADERAAASGQPPFNARELIDRTKRNYTDFADSHGWGRSWRREQRAWRRQWRANRWQSGRMWGPWYPGAPPPGTYGSRMASSLLVPILTVVCVLFFWIWAWAIFSLVTSGRVLSMSLPDDVPYWVGILALVCLFNAVMWPLRLARRRAAYHAFGGSHYDMIGAWSGLASLAMVGLGLWVAYRYVPEVREILRALPDVWNSLIRSLDS